MKGGGDGLQLPFYHLSSRVSGVPSPFLGRYLGTSNLKKCGRSDAHNLRGNTSDGGT